MRCLACKSEMEQGLTELVLKRNCCVVVIEGVPAVVCKQCGEASIDLKISKIAYDTADKEIQRGEMSISQEKNRLYPAIIGAEIGEDVIIANMSDGRTISIPIGWFERLSSATKKDLSHFTISPAGYGIHWPDIDEDVSVKAFIDGLSF